MSNLPNVLDRDLVVLHKGDTITVAISSTLAVSGWAGGQFCRWVDEGTGELTVAIADGRYCGFLPFGSSESGDQYTAMTNQNSTYRYATMFFGGNIFYTRTYEVYGYLARHSLGPVVPLVYGVGQFLYVSENGKLTTEDESDFGIFPPHPFPDGTPITVRFVFFGVCAVPPSAATKNYIAIQTNFGI